MTPRALFGSVALLATVAVLFWAPVASASTTPCSGVLGPVAVANVVVPGHASCQMNGTQVSGDVVVETGGVLRVAINTAIAGDVGCRRCDWLGIFETDVGGSVRAIAAGEAVFVEISSVVGNLEIVGGAAGAPITITRGSVFGDLFLSRNGGSLEMTREEVGGDARIVDNVSPVGFSLQENIIGRDLLFSRNSGPSALNSNSIGESLGCFENSPSPTGSGNVALELTGQCEGLG